MSCSPIPTRRVSFCVDGKHIVPCVKSISSGHSITMEGHDGTVPQVVIRSGDPERPSHEKCAELNTYVTDAEVSLFPMDFKMMLEIDLYEVSRYPDRCNQPGGTSDYQRISP